MLNPIEMGMPSTAAVIDRITEEPRYIRAFQKAFGPNATITIDRVAQAIASYERTLITVDSPYDDFIRGNEGALSEAAKHGMHLFGKLGCKLCHTGPNFSDASLIGPSRPFAYLHSDRLDPQTTKTLDADKGMAAPDARLGLWRVPSLRNVELTGPYFHNGAVDTLEEAVTIMAKVQINAKIVPENNSAVDMKLTWSQTDKKFFVTEDRVVSKNDIEDLVAFLKALTSKSLADKAQQLY